MIWKGQGFSHSVTRGRHGHFTPNASMLSVCMFKRRYVRSLIPIIYKYRNLNPKYLNILQNLSQAVSAIVLDGPQCRHIQVCPLRCYAQSHQLFKTDLMQKRAEEYTQTKYELIPYRFMR